ncbi:MAG TPA: cytochrome c3 family protein [Planctomycetota bacterium]|nr:cytochrome c3 family protein [Planctomycetota bacterium]
MKVRSVHFWIAVFSLAAVVGMAVVDLRRTAPGELTSVHGREQKLEGGANCNACHGGLFSDMTDACLECHATIAAQVEEARGLHGALAEEEAQQCAQCHSEHHGPTFDIVNRQSFARAGVPDPRRFDHARIGWEMSGAHVPLACSACHVNAFVPVLPAGAARYLGLAQDCASCHDDPHAGTMKVSCASCHGQESWDKLHADGHEQHLELIGGHGDVDCRGCHAKDGERALEAMDKRRATLAPRTCAECHPSPHAPEFARKNALADGLAVEKSCVTCHAAAHDSFRDERLVLTPEQHARSGFALDAPHAETKCAQCHAPDAPTFAESYPGRAQDRCSACHADPHGGQFAEGPFSEGDCLACHERTRFEPHAFDVAKHARADFALTGTHVRTECRLCHADPQPADAPRQFQKQPATCEACHADAHAGAFDAQAALMTPLAAGECARCHETTQFAEVPRFDHGAWTGFAIEGAHAQSACEACHFPRAARDEHGRAFGRIEEHFESYRGCSSCHQDPHEGRFDAAALPAKVDGKQDCARCHDTSSFRTLWKGFEHGRWTGFELRQGHARASCSDCHTPRARENGVIRSWEPALGSACADCHDDPHSGQFAVAGATTCAACHAEDARNFTKFDHERDSRFALGETHEDVACAACHQPERPAGVKNAAAFVRYKPLGTQCADCHGVHDEVLLRRKPANK